jgi:hypothetical protein
LVDFLSEVAEFVHHAMVLAKVDPFLLPGLVGERINRCGRFHERHFLAAKGTFHSANPPSLLI